MRRILLVLSVALVMAAMMVASAMPAFADPPLNQPIPCTAPLNSSGNHSGVSSGADVKTENTPAPELNTGAGFTVGSLGSGCDVSPGSI